jgi:predicted metalloprotease
VTATRRALALRRTQDERDKLLFFLAAAAAIVALAASVVARALEEGNVAYSDPFNRWPPAQAGGSGNAVADAPARGKELTRFLSFVAADVQQYWARQFERAGIPYAPARVVVFRRRVRTGCGRASAAVGPFYCTLDRTVYLDPGFFRQLAVEYKARGDFAQAYVIAHEMGHHVQNLTGVTLQESRWIQEGAAPPNLVSIAAELQADCLAGVWGHSTYERGMLDDGDVQEALRAAAAVGDDRIQARTMGRIDPETWTHGSSEQRLSWFARGFDQGVPAACDTFSALG